MNVLLTGSSGLIGRAVYPRLLQRGYKVRTVASQPPADLVGDLKDSCVAHVAVQGMDAVVHLAGRRGSVGIQNTRGAELLLENLAIDAAVFSAMRKAKITQGVYASTVSVYPELDRDAKEEDMTWQPAPSVAFSAWSKITGERILAAWQEESNHTITTVRLVNTYGPHDDFDPDTALVVPALIRKIEMSAPPLVVWGSGSTIRDVLFVNDAARGIVDALEKGDGETINLGSGRGVAVQKIVDEALRSTGNVPEYPVVYSSVGPTGARRKTVDTTKARTLLGWQAEVSLAEGLRETVAWWRSEGKNE